MRSRIYFRRAARSSCVRIPSTVLRRASSASRASRLRQAENWLRISGPSVWLARKFRLSCAGRRVLRRNSRTHFIIELTLSALPFSLVIIDTLAARPVLELAGQVDKIPHDGFEDDAALLAGGQRRVAVNA